MSCDYIYIYKGDDTNWNNEQLLDITLVPAPGSTIDLSSMTAEFTLGSYTKTEIPLINNSFTIDLGAAVTGAFPYGAIMGVVKLFDSTGRVKTVVNQIPFYVTNEVIATQNRNLTFDLPQVSINVTVGGTVSYNNITDKPSINDITIQGEHDASYYNLAKETDLQSHISDTNNPHEVTKSQVGLGNVDNTSDDNKPISIPTQAALDTKMPLAGGTFTGNVTFANGTAVNFPNTKLSENNAGNFVIGDGNGNGMVIVPDGVGAAFFYNNGTEYTEVVAFKDVKSTYNAASTYPMDGVAVSQAVSAEATIRSNADDNLQGQIDALSAASDVTDVVGTYAELQSYDTQHLKDNDIIKVLSDSTHDNAPSYYRWSTHTNTFTYIGSESASYTKAQADAKFLTQTSAASTYETQTAASASLALKASNADESTIVDNGTVITTVAIREQRANTPIKQWVGTKAEYEAISTKNSNTTYIVTDEDDSKFLTVDSVLSASSENPVQNKVIYQALQDILNNIPSGGGAPTLYWYTGITGSTVTVASTSGATLVKVYKNGLLLQPTEDYSLSGTTLTMVSALVSTDKITLEVF